MDISVIVPVYNAERTLNRCINSILSQSLSNFELLLIDDGSNDDSPRICDFYANNDVRVKTYHKHNGGVSSARQFGVERSSGVWILYVDSDDWIEPNMLACLLEEAYKHAVDIVMCDVYLHTGMGVTRSIQKPSNVDDCHQMQCDLLEDKIQSYLCNKLIRRELLLSSGAFPDARLCMWEDKYLLGILFSKNITCAYINNALYHYDLLTNNSSLSRSVSAEQIDSMVYVIRALEQIYNSDAYLTGINEMKSHCIYRSLYVNGYDLPGLFPEYQQTYITKLGGAPHLYYRMKLMRRMNALADMFWAGYNFLKKVLRYSRF